MGCHEVELVDIVRRPSGQHRLKAGMRAQFFKEGRHGIGIIAGTRDIANAKHIRFKLVLTREGFKIGVGTRSNNLASTVANRGGKTTGQNLCDHAAAIALGGMAGDHMADFMGQNAGKFCFVGCKGGQTARDIDIPARQGKGVDHGGVKNRKGELLIWRF